MMLRGLLALLLIAAAVPAEAQTYPQRPVRLISPIPPGGAPDLIARAVGHRLALGLGQPVVIATGGLAELVATHSTTIEVVDPFLTLDGLRLVWELNRD